MTADQTTHPTKETPDLYGAEVGAAVPPPGISPSRAQVPTT
jgi:hypothetical protein